MHARLYILLLSSWQSSEISARHTAAVGSSFISHFLRLCAVAGALSYSSSPSFSLLPPRLFSIESYTVRYISSDVFSEKFSKELVLLKNAEMNVSGFTKVHIIEERGTFQAMASVPAGSRAAFVPWTSANYLHSLKVQWEHWWRGEETAIILEQGHTISLKIQKWQHMLKLAISC